MSSSGLVKSESNVVELTSGGTKECSFTVSYSDYSKWFDDSLSPSEKPYSFELTMSIGMYDVNNPDEMYNAIIEKRNVGICSPIHRLNTSFPSFLLPLVYTLLYLA